MRALYHKNSPVRKLKEIFSAVFTNETAPTRKHMIDLLMSVIALNSFQSVQYNYEHFIQDVSDSRLKSYYYALNESALDIDDWTSAMMRLAISLIPKALKEQPIILSVDDTVTEKYGEHFEYCSVLFDHAAHHGSLYLNGHCFVGLMISVPVMENGIIKYLSVPVGYRMWTKEETKLEMAADLVRLAMQVIGTKKTVILCCDSWYPKAEITELPDEFENLDILCNVRCDTALYELPPKPTGKRGRPRIRGERISLNDFTLQEIRETGYRAGGRKVITRLFGKRSVHAVVTESKSGSRRLFLCTKSPQKLHFDTNCSNTGKAAAYGKTDISLLPLTIYALRWHIETAFYEQKRFWSFGSYMLRSKNGIECLLNLLTILYSMMTLLPFLDSDFSFLSGESPQQSRFLLSRCLHQELFFATFGCRPKITKNNSARNFSRSHHFISV
ncbi:MAG: transposase [Oscillospiraceae bacterium]|nr:transposase [Oscillospiraceae bacterium]